jgi:DnaK suppressor protein
VFPFFLHKPPFHQQIVNLFRQELANKDIAKNRCGAFMFCKIPDKYRPSEDEPFMNDRQREYFRRRLVEWRDSLIHSSRETLHHLQEDIMYATDIVDQASLEEEIASELCMRDHECKLLVKIEEALRKLEDGTYGYCEETGEKIGLKRLESRLVATLCYEAQEERERLNRLCGKH